MAGDVCDDALVTVLLAFRRGHVVLVAVVALALLLSSAVSPVATAQERDSSTTVTQVPTRDIIPRPNQGVAPHDAGDRGGAAQLALVVAILGGLATIAFLATRESRRARARATTGGRVNVEEPGASP